MSYTGKTYVFNESLPMYTSSSTITALFVGPPDTYCFKTQDDTLYYSMESNNTAFYYTATQRTSVCIFTPPPPGSSDPTFEWQNSAYRTITFVTEPVFSPGAEEWFNTYASEYVEPDQTEYLTTGTELASIANALRTRNRSVGSIQYPDGFVSAINNLVNVSDTSAIELQVHPSAQFYRADGTKVYGQMPTQDAATYNASTSEQTISSGVYLSGNQTIRAITTSNIDASNIKTGVTVQVGDSGSATRIKNVTGTFTSSSTVSGGQTAADAGQILNGYSAWVDGEEVQGNIATKTASNLTASGKTVTVPAGYYAAQATKDVATGTATTPATTITAAPTITVDASGLITATNSKTQSVTPTVSAGYVATGTAGTITVNGSNTSQLTVQTAQTITPGTTNKTIASARYLTGTQTIKGDANLVAANIAKGVSIFGVTGTYDAGVNEFIVNRTIPSVVDYNISKIGTGAFVGTPIISATFPSCTQVGAFAFELCTSLTTATFAKATIIGWGAFQYCTHLSSISFPLVTTIGNSAFQSCIALKSFTFPKVTSIYEYAFYSCSGITSIPSTAFPVCTNIGNYTFYACSSISTVSMSKVTTIGNYAFINCTSLATASFPAATTIGSSAFQACTVLRTTSFPLAKTIGSSAFRNCYSLSTISLPACTTIHLNAFATCRTLLSLYLMGSSYVTLSYINAFASTPISNYTTYTSGSYGKIYVPSSMLASYKTMTNWSTYSARFVGV